MIIARIPFLNTAPFFHFLSQRWLNQHTWVEASPRDLGELARQGKADAGIFSLVDAWTLVESGDFEFLGDLGIAGFGPIGSILLFGAEDAKKLEGQAVAVTPQTATTSRLLEIWLRHKVGLKKVSFVPQGQASQATLLIGDDALMRREFLAPHQPQPIDLCEAWQAWTGLPFVFARWAVRKDLPEAEKRDLRGAILSALELALDDLEDVARRASEDHGLSPETVTKYLLGIRYKLDEQDQAGMKLFRQYLEENGGLKKPLA